jgi:hypothetical protein
MGLQGQETFDRTRQTKPIESIGYCRGPDTAKPSENLRFETSTISHDFLPSSA